MTTDTPVPVDLDTLSRLEAAATEAPWVAINTLDENSEWGSDFDDPMVVTEDSYPGAYSAIANGICQGSTNGVADAEFIAAARNAMPALLALVDRQAAELDRYRSGAAECIDHQPRRDDAVAIWLKQLRDDRPGAGESWALINDLLDLYREHADTGTPLSQEVLGPHWEVER